MDKFEFDLHMFEGGEELAGDSTVTEATEHIQEVEDSTPSRAPYQLVVDEETGRRSLALAEQVDSKHDKEDENDQCGEQEDLKNSTERETTDAIQPYTSDELIRAMTLNQVNENRIPPALQGDYVAIKAQRELDIMKQQSQVVKPAENDGQSAGDGAQIDTIIKFNASIKEYSEQQALRDMGLTAEALEDLRYADNENSRTKLKQYEDRAEAYNRDIREKIDAQKFAEHQIRENAVQLMRQAAPVIEEYKKDPAFTEIDIMMNTYFKQLPFEQANQIVETMNRMTSGVFNQNDLNILDSYYKLTREAYYAKKNGISNTPKKVTKPTKPPYIESAGNGQQPAVKINYKEMRSMDKRERSDFVQDILKLRLNNG